MALKDKLVTLEDLAIVHEEAVDLAERADLIETELENKANVDGMYESMTVGNAEQLLSDNYTEDSEPYVFRKSVSGDREFDEIVGGTIAWNQLVPNANKSFSNSQTDGRTYVNLYWRESVSPYTSLANTSITKADTYEYIVPASATMTTLIIHNGSQQNFTFCNNINVIGGHKYYFGIKFTGVDPTTVGGCSLDNLMIIDLTQMFGSTIADYMRSLEQATAGAGVALFRSLFPKPYYEYNPGELKSITGLVSHDTVGFNQWDEEWELGQFNNQTGLPISTNDCIRSKNFIPVLPNTTYYTTYGNGNMQVFFYGADETFISQAWVGVTNLITTPNGCYKMKFRNASSYGTTYNHDICINISDPSKNGTYEPYVKRSYPLDSSLTLRGIPKLANNKMYFDGDTYESDGTVTRRYGIVDLGTLNWVFATSTSYFYATIGAPKRPSAWNQIPNVLCSAYRVGTANEVADSSQQVDRTISIPPNSDRVVIYDSNYTDPATLKSMLTGQHFIYELATPTTETAEPFQSPQICSEYGTEEYVYDSEAFPVPVGHVTKYPDNLRKKIDGLPWDLSMIAPVETGTKASQAYAIGKYFLLNNQFCKAKTAIASGATFTLNTNYEVTTIADELYTALHS